MLWRTSLIGSPRSTNTSNVAFLVLGILLNWKWTRGRGVLSRYQQTRGGGEGGGSHDGSKKVSIDLFGQTEMCRLRGLSVFPLFRPSPGLLSKQAFTSSEISGIFCVCQRFRAVWEVGGSLASNTMEAHTESLLGAALSWVRVRFSPAP